MFMDIWFFPRNCSQERVVFKPNLIGQKLGIDFYLMGVLSGISNSSPFLFCQLEGTPLQ